MYRFVACAAGLVVGGGAVSVRKPVDGGPKVGGVPGVLQGTKAFSAVAGIVAPAEPVNLAIGREPIPLGEDGNDGAVPATAHEVAAGEAWFRASVADEKGSVFVGVAAPETPLDTPLSWEEDHSYLLECKPNGGFLWSERAVVYGAPLTAQSSPASGAPVATTPKCLVRQADGTYAGRVRVSWDAESVNFAVFDVSDADTAGAAAGPRVAARAMMRPLRGQIQGRDAHVEASPPLRPFVTLSTPLAAAELLPGAPSEQ